MFADLLRKIDCKFDRQLSTKQIKKGQKQLPEAPPGKAEIAHREETEWKGKKSRPWKKA